MMLHRAHLYFAENRPAIATATHYNSAGIYYEQDGPAVLTDWSDPYFFAAAVRSKLELFSFREADLRNHKESEWPSYLASRISSIREFKRSYICVTLRGLNEAELFYDACAQPQGEDDIALHVTINRYGSDDEFGRKLITLFDRCSAWPGCYSMKYVRLDSWRRRFEIHPPER